MFLALLLDSRQSDTVATVTQALLLTDYETMDENWYLYYIQQTTYPGLFLACSLCQATSGSATELPAFCGKKTQIRSLFFIRP
jgi:hypothetical protein